MPRSANGIGSNAIAGALIRGLRLDEQGSVVLALKYGPEGFEATMANNPASVVVTAPSAKETDECKGVTHVDVRGGDCNYA